MQLCCNEVWVHFISKLYHRSFAIKDSHIFLRFSWASHRGVPALLHLGALEGKAVLTYEHDRNLIFRAAFWDSMKQPAKRVPAHTSVVQTSTAGAKCIYVWLCQESLAVPVVRRRQTLEDSTLAKWRRSKWAPKSRDERLEGFITEGMMSTCILAPLRF